MQHHMLRSLMTTSDIAARFTVNRSTVHRWVVAGLLTPVQTIGGVRLFDPEDVDRFAAEREVAS